MEENKKYSPILPYDDTKFDSFTVYTPTDYSVDLELMPEHPIQMHHPNMIKYFRAEDVPPVKIGGD